MRRDLPSGTVTFLFTDVEGSTRLLHELGAAGYAGALAEHRRLIRAACASHEGVEVDTQGDAFFFAFPTAPGALAAARAIVDSLATGPIRVRLGVHTGTPLTTEEGYVGADVHRAARIAAAGHGGQVLVSSATAALVDPGDSRPGGVPLVDLGEHRLKDLAAPERIHQLGDGEHPPLNSLHRTNLPVPATPFLGREAELADVVELLGRPDIRLVTLVGPGGTGKTRLALQAAAAISDAFPDGLWWIALAPLRDPALVLPAVAQAAGIREQPEEPLAATLATALAGKRTLLLLDNLEHLLPQAALELAPLLSTSGPVLLVTSRERLQLQGEHVYPVPTLDERDGVALFLARARALAPSFSGGEAVADLCARLDNLPLALELAAARTVVFSAEQLLGRLGNRLDLLKGGRDADPRQQTLRATIEWSHELLDADERRLFRALSVFSGGCTFEAAEAVAEADPDTVQSLVDKSLLRHRDDEPAPRFWMLETLREFAAEQLQQRGETHDLAGTHARYYADLATSGAEALRAGDTLAFAVVNAELGNFRSGLRAALADNDAVLAGRYLDGLWFYWLTQGFGTEAAQAVAAWRALDRSQLAPSDQATGLLGAGEIVRFTGDVEEAIELKREALSLAVAHPKAEAAGRPMGGWRAAILADLAHLLVDAGRPAEAQTCAEQALALRRERGEPRGVAHAQAALAAIADASGDFVSARELMQAAAEGFARGGSREDATLRRAGAAEYEFLLGDAEAATRTFVRALADGQSLRDQGVLEAALRIGATIALNSGEPADAALLFAAAGRLRTTAGIETRSRAERERDEHSQRQLAATIDEATQARAAAAAETEDPVTLVQELASRLAKRA